MWNELALLVLKIYVIFLEQISSDFYSSYVVSKIKDSLTVFCYVIMFIFLPQKNLLSIMLEHFCVKIYYAFLSQAMQPSSKTCRKGFSQMQSNVFIVRCGHAISVAIN